MATAHPQPAPSFATDPAGSIKLRTRELIRSARGIIARLGRTWCPKDRKNFSNLSVRENLLLPPVLAKGGMSLAEVIALFPNLAAHLEQDGSKHSGGEQQMLATARILRTGSNLLLLDEPKEGLAPVIVKQIEAVICRLKARGFTNVLVEQNFHSVFKVSGAYYPKEFGPNAGRIRAAEVEINISKIHGDLGV